MYLKRTTLAAIGLLAVFAIAVACYRYGGTRAAPAGTNNGIARPYEQPGGKTSQPSPVKRAAADGASRPLSPESSAKRVSTAAPASAMSVLDSLLASDARDRWLSAAKVLSRLPPNEQWSVLTSPGIANQPYAKLLRYQLVTACSVTLGQLDVGVDATNVDDPPAVVEWCKDLAKAGSRRGLFAQTRSDNAEVINPEWWVPEVDPDELTSDERDVQASDLRARFERARTFAELRSALSALWDTHDDVFGVSWPSVHHLSRYEQSLLSIIVPLAGACAVTGSCGPNSVHTMRVCALFPGFQCAVGMSFQDVLRWNVSPRNDQTIKMAVANIASRYQSQR